MKKLATCRTLVVQYTSDEALENSVKLARKQFRKPLMAKARVWLERLVVQDVDAFLFLSRYIELKLAGQHWTCWGMLIHPLDDLNPNVAEILLANIGPCFCRIDLGPNPSPYKGILENLR